MMMRIVIILTLASIITLSVNPHERSHLRGGVRVARALERSATLNVRSMVWTWQAGSGGRCGWHSLPSQRVHVFGYT